jgi:hypothetical protein
MKFKHEYATPQYSGNYIRQAGIGFDRCNGGVNLDPVGFRYQVCNNDQIQRANPVVGTPFGRCSNWRFTNTQTQISNQPEIIDGTLVIAENGQFRNPRLAIFEISPQAIYKNIKSDRMD